MTTLIWSLATTLYGQSEAPSSEGVETSYEHSWDGPPWLTLVVIACALGVVGYAYARERGGASRAARGALWALRAALLGMIVAMFYGWSAQRHRTDLPDLVVILDDSASMAVADAWDEEEAPRALLAKLGRVEPGDATRWRIARELLLDAGRPWREALEARYRVKWFLAGASLRPLVAPGATLEESLASLEPQEPASRLGQAVADVLQMQRGRPTAAILLLTDGVTTDGPAISDAARQARRRQTPLYALGIGGERPPRDVRLAELRVDETAFVRDVLHFDVQLAARGYAGRTVRLQLFRAGEPQPLAETEVALAADGAGQSARLSYRPTSEGRFSFVVEARPLAGESSLDNNRLEREVTVTEETVRVLLVQSAPSYEFRYLRTLLDRSLNVGSRAGKRAIDLRVYLQEADWERTGDDETALRVFPVTREELFQFDVVVLGDVSPGALGPNAMRNLADFVQTRGGGLVILSGPRFQPRAFAGTPLVEVLPFDPETCAPPLADAELRSGFRPRLTALGAATPALQLVDSLGANQGLWRKLPELYWLLEAPEIKPGVRVLAEHPTRVSPDGRSWPVLLLQFVDAGKVLTHATDDLWRWSRDPDGEEAYGRYWLQWLRYLSRGKLQSGERGVQVASEREEYPRGEPARLRVRFLDERAAPAADDGVTLILEREGGGRRNVTLARDANDRGVFAASVGQLAEGRYRAGLLRPAFEPPPAPANFTVVAPPGEQARLEMDGNDLRLAAKRSEGKFYALRDVDRLLDELPPGRQVRIESLPAEPLWNRWPWAAAFVALLVGEWIARKRLGML